MLRHENHCRGFKFQGTQTEIYIPSQNSVVAYQHWPKSDLTKLIVFVQGGQLRLPDEAISPFLLWLHNSSQ